MIFFFLPILSRYDIYSGKKSNRTRSNSSVKLVTNSLAVQELRSNRLKKTSPLCSICGREVESNYHAVMHVVHQSCCSTSAYAP